MTTAPGILRPHTPLGTWASRLSGAFVLLFASWLLYVAATPMSRPTFFSDPIHAVILLAAVAAAIAGGVVGLGAIVVKRDVTILTLASVALGGFVLWWMIAEIIGH